MDLSTVRIEQGRPIRMKLGEVYSDTWVFNNSPLAAYLWGVNRGDSLLVVEKGPNGSVTSAYVGKLDFILGEETLLLVDTVPVTIKNLTPIPGVDRHCNISYEATTSVKGAMSIERVLSRRIQIYPLRKEPATQTPQAD